MTVVPAPAFQSIEPQGPPVSRFAFSLRSTVPTCIADASVTRTRSAVSVGKARQTAHIRAALMSVKAASMGGDQVSTSGPFRPPFNSPVRGRRILATEGMKWW